MATVVDDGGSSVKVSVQEGDWTPYEATKAYPKVNKFFKTRWTHMYPLQRRVFMTYTLGEAIILTVAFLAFFGGFAIGVVSNSVEGSGSLPTWPFAFVYATACHNSLITFLLGVPFERALTYHKIAGYMALVMTFLHGIIAVDHDGWNSSFTGNVLWGTAILISLTSLYPIRRSMFEFFMYNHWFFAMLGGVFCVAHGAGGVLYGMILWMVDCAYRYYAYRTMMTHEAKCEALPADVIKVSFPASSFPRYKGGQYVFICIPELSMFQWHPFSFSSAPHEEMVCIHIRVLGNWTSTLRDKLKAAGGSQTLKVWMDGPYGEPFLDVESDRYKTFLLISGGIGITPMQSICNELIEQHERGRPLHKIWFVWSVRDKYMVDAVENVNINSAHRLPYSFQPDHLSVHSRSRSILGDDGAATAAMGGDEEEVEVEIAGHGGGGSDDVEAARTTRTTAALSDGGGGAPSKGVAPPRVVAEDILHTTFYLTQAREPADYADAGIKPAVQECLRFGRPKLLSIFEKMKEVAKAAGDDRVAVLTCGPEGMVADVGDNCVTQSDEDVLFEFHSETFMF